MIRSLVALALALSACATADAPSATRVAGEAGNPLDLRRTTLIVGDVERSLALYRDALGMVARYDQELTSPGLARADADGVNRSRLVLLKTNDDFVAGLGLWQFLDRPAPPGPVGSGAFETGEVVLLFNSERLDEQFAAAAQVPGVTVVERPHLRDYPGPGGTTISVMVSTLLDPDGYVVELNQLLGPRGERTGEGR